MSEYPGKTYLEYPDAPYGLGGGTLSAFWTSTAGSAILGRRGGMNAPGGKAFSFDRPDEWRNWPVHAVIGSTAGGKFFTSARIAEQVRAGIQALPRGQRYAGMAVGFTTAQTYRYVILPMAFRIILPPLTSEFLNTIKNTAVAITIGLIELTGEARSMQEFSFQVFEAFTAATVLYLLINIVVVTAMRLLERGLAVPGYISGK